MQLNNIVLLLPVYFVEKHLALFKSNFTSILLVIWVLSIDIDMIGYNLVGHR